MRYRRRIVIPDRYAQSAGDSHFPFSLFSIHEKRPKHIVQNAGVFFRSLPYDAGRYILSDLGADDVVEQNSAAI